MKDNTMNIWAGIGVVVVILGVVGVNVARISTTTEHTSCVIEEKEERALASLDKRDPRVTTDCGVFTVSDEAFRFHFNSADVYGDLTVGETVDLTTVGWRFGLFSWFPNVIEVRS